MRTTPILTALLGAAALSLTACGGGDTTLETTAETPAEVEAKVVTMDDVIAHPRRAKEAARDQFRNPKETSEFFEIAAGKRVGEIWPGWYTNITAPYLLENDGEYVAILYPEGRSEKLDKRVAAYKNKFSDTAIYGEIEYASFLNDSGPILAEGQEKFCLLYTSPSPRDA